MLQALRKKKYCQEVCGGERADKPGETEAECRTNAYFNRGTLALLSTLVFETTHLPRSPQNLHSSKGDQQASHKH